MLCWSICCRWDSSYHCWSVKTIFTTLVKPKRCSSKHSIFANRGCLRFLAPWHFHNEFPGHFAHFIHIPQFPHFLNSRICRQVVTLVRRVTMLFTGNQSSVSAETSNIWTQFKNNTIWNLLNSIPQQQHILHTNNKSCAEMRTLYEYVSSSSSSTNWSGFVDHNLT